MRDTLRTKTSSGREALNCALPQKHRRQDSKPLIRALSPAPPHQRWEEGRCLLPPRTRIVGTAGRDERPFPQMQLGREKVGTIPCQT